MILTATLATLLSARLRTQFAYHEVSYFLVRLLQSFDAFSLDMDTQHLPPADWAQAEGRQGLEKVVMRAHLTLYVKVWVLSSIALHFRIAECIGRVTGWSVGQDEGGRPCPFYLMFLPGPVCMFSHVFNNPFLFGFRRSLQAQLSM